MYHKMKPWNILIVASFMLLLAACSSTQLVSSWHKPDGSVKPVKRVLILGIMPTDLQRRTIEDAFVQRFEKESVTGIAGYTLMSNPDDYDEVTEIREAVTKSGADASMIISLVEDKKQERYVPPSVDYVPSSADSVARENTHLIVKSMKKANLIK